MARGFGTHETELPLIMRILTRTKPNVFPMETGYSKNYSHLVQYRHLIIAPVDRRLHVPGCTKPIYNKLRYKPSPLITHILSESKLLPLGR